MIKHKKNTIVTKLKMWQDSKSENSKTKLWHNTETQNVTKFKNMKYNKTQTLEMWHNSKTQIVKKLKNSNKTKLKKFNVRHLKKVFLHHLLDWIVTHKLKLSEKKIQVVTQLKN